MVKPRDLTETQQKLWEASVFFGKFLVAGAFFHLLVVLDLNTSWAQQPLARSSAAAMNFLGFESVSSGSTVLVAGQVFEVTRDCLGWKSIAALAGLGFASNLRNPIYLLAGSIAIVVANFVRVVTTLLLAQYLSFNLVHGTMWRWGLAAATLLVWIGWLGAEKHGEPLYYFGRALTRVREPFYREFWKAYA